MGGDRRDATGVGNIRRPIRSEMQRDLPSDKARIQFLSSQLYELNGQLTERANTFSEVLGAGSGP